MLAMRASRIPEPLELVVRPGAVMRRVLAGEAGWTAVLAAFAAPLAAVAAFFAYSYVGTVTAGHFLASFVAYALVFFGQTAIFAAVARVATRRPLRACAHTFALTYLPVELFFLFLFTVFLLASAPYQSIFTLLRSYVLPSVFAGMLAWNALLVYVALRELGGGRRLRALAAMVVHYAVFGGLIVAYCYGMDLLPFREGA